MQTILRRTYSPSHAKLGWASINFAEWESGQV